jgi:hypothetical protein
MTDIITDFSKAKIIRNIDDIYYFLKKEKCPACKYSMEVANQSTTIKEEKVYDIILCICRKCHLNKNYIFDISYPYNLQQSIFKKI